MPQLVKIHRVIIESPYAGHGESEGEVKARVRMNVEYARAAVRDSVLRGEAPIASHLLFTQEGILNNEVPSERAMGIQAGLAWGAVAQLFAFYTDNGWSPGMRASLDKLMKYQPPGVGIALRSLRESAQLPREIPQGWVGFLLKCVEAPRKGL